MKGLTVITTLPPWPGISVFSIHALEALSKRLETIQVIQYRRLYPPFFRGAVRTDTPWSPPPSIRVDPLLDLYNPWSWKKVANRILYPNILVEWWHWAQLPALWAIFRSLHQRPFRPFIVLELHNPASHEPHRVENLFLHKVIHGADALVVHTQASKEKLKTRWSVPSDKIHVIPYGPYRFPGPTRTKEEAREVLGWPQEIPILLFFGNIRPYKGLDRILQAFRQIRQHLPQARLVIRGRLMDTLSRYTSLLEQPGVDVRWGYVPDPEVSLLFRASDVLVLPYTHFDSQSGVIMLALSHGVPYLVSDVPGLKEFAIDGWVASSVEEIAGALVRFFQDPAFRKTIKQAFRNVQTRYSWESFASALVRVFSRRDPQTSK